MRVLGLDISTKTGYAVVEDGVLIDYGLRQIPKIDAFPHLPEDFPFIYRANRAADEIMKVIVKHDPEKIMIEQTNLGRSRTDQKQLEFIHFAVLSKIMDMEREKQVTYVDTSRWRSMLQIKLSKDQRKHNKAVKAGEARGKVTPKHLAVAWANETYKLTLLKKDHDIADAIALATLGEKQSNEPPIDPTPVEDIILGATK